MNYPYFRVEILQPFLGQGPGPRRTQSTTPTLYILQWRLKQKQTPLSATLSSRGSMKKLPLNSFKQGCRTLVHLCPKINVFI